MDNLSTNIQDPSSRPRKFTLLLLRKPAVRMVLNRGRDCGKPTLFTSDYVSGLNDEINNVRAEVIRGEGSHVTKHPVIADEDVEGWVNPFWNIVFDCSVKLEQIWQVGASLFEVVDRADPPIR